MDFLDGLRIFLNEVCVFLDKEVLKTNHNEDFKSKATKLIRNAMVIRDKSVLALQIPDTDGYIDMMKKVIKDEYVGPDIKPIYEQDVDYSVVDYVPSEKPVQPLQSIENKVVMVVKPEDNVKVECPYQNAFLRELKPIKEGTLLRKEYILHYVPINRLYFVVLLDEWLLFYNSSRKHKAMECYSLHGVRVKNHDDKGGTFIVDVDENTFTLTADTRKEKIQWMSAISDIDNFKSFERSASQSQRNRTTSEKHISIESNQSDIYAAIDESHTSLPEYINTNSNSSPDSPNPNPTLPPRSYSALPPLPTSIPSIPSPQDVPVGPEDDYQFLPPPPSLVEVEPEEIYQYAPAAPPPADPALENQNGHDAGAPEDIYDYVGHAEHIEYPGPEEIYESIEEPAYNPNLNNNEMAGAALPPQVPPPPSQMTMMSELKLKQKLYQLSKGTTGTAGTASNAVETVHVEEKAAETPKNERRKKIRRSFGIGSRKRKA